VTKRKKITKKTPRSATAISGVPIGKLVLAAADGDRWARNKLRDHPALPSDWCEQFMSMWKDRIESNRRTIENDSDSEFIRSCRQSLQQVNEHVVRLVPIGIMELRKFLIFAQEKRKRGAPLTEKNWQIFAEFAECEQSGKKYGTAARARKYGITLGNLQQLYKRWKKTKLKDEREPIW
jgi:hypothetical protein